MVRRYLSERTDRENSVTVPRAVNFTSVVNGLSWLDKALFAILTVGILVGSSLLLATNPRIWFLIVGLLVGVVIFIVLLPNTRTIVLLVVIYAPFELLVYKFLPAPLNTVSRYATEALLLLTFVALIADRLLRQKTWKKTPLDIPLLLFVGAGILSGLVNAVSPVVTLLGMRILLRYVLLYYLITQIGFDRKTIRPLLAGMLGAAIIVVGLGFAQSLLGQSVSDFLTVQETTLGTITLRDLPPVRLAQGTYIYSTLGRYDLLGLYSALILLLLLSLFMHYPRRRTSLLLLLVPVGICLMLSMSRQSWLLVYTGLVAWVFVQRNIKLGTLLILAPLVLTGLAMSLPHLVRYYSGSELSQASVLTRLLEPYSPEYRDISANSGGRLYVIFNVGSRILEETFLFGFGPGRFGSLTSEVFDFSAADLLSMSEWQLKFLNDVNWITVLGQYGVIGTTAFALMFGTLFRYAWRVYRRSADPLTKSVNLACLGSIAGLMTAAFAGPNFEQRVFSMYIWLFAGMAVSLARAERHARARQVESNQA